jgi:hypothetical protein
LRSTPLSEERPTERPPKLPPRPPDPSVEAKIGRTLGKMFGKLKKTKVWRQTADAYREGLEGKR